MEITNLDDIPNFTVELDDNYDYLDNEQIVNLLNGKDNISISSTLTNLQKLDDNGSLLLPTKVIIKNASELDAEKMSQHQCISTVQIKDGDNTGIQQINPYTRAEYESVRSEIDKILSQIKYPEENDPNREKKIFSQIYKILGTRISYDHNAISDSEKNNERLQITCRNLLGGLIEDKCVCAGYADILRNTLACANIYSEYVGAAPDIDSGVPLDLNDPSGHAWNLVMLDGKKYWTDLTWDANALKTGRYPLQYCLKSTKDFHHDKFTKRIQDQIEDPCLESLTEEEQFKLFTGKELECKTDTQRQENKAIGYLSDCIMSIASSGLRSKEMRITADTFSKCTSIQVIKKNEMEVADGRS